MSEYFNNKWVLEKEKELRELQRNYDAATDPGIKKAVHYMMEVTVEELKLRFQREEVSWLAKHVLLEWRKKAVDMQWVSPTQAQQVNSIWCPLPYPCKEIHGQSSTPKRKSQKRQISNLEPQFQKEEELSTFSARVKIKWWCKFHSLTQE